MLGMIVDCHTHAFPDALAPRAIAQLCARAGVTPRADGTLAGLREAMRRAGVDRAVVAPVATKPAQVRPIDEWAVAGARCEPAFIPFGGLHPAQEDWDDEVAWLLAQGVRGVKLHPDYQQVFVDDPAFIARMRSLADAGLVVLLHAGVDIGIPAPVHATPARLARLLDAVPGLTLIAAHMGGFRCWDEVERLLVGRDVYLDTCYSLPDLGPERALRMIRAHGTDKVLFGSDSPWADPADDLAFLRALSLEPDERDAILGGNTVRVLGLQG